MPRVALAFAYDGTRFDSFARQPGRRTVEGELLRCLRDANVLDDARSARYVVASRTDAGVSAAFNVCALDTATHPGSVAARPEPPDGLWLLAGRRVDDAFNPRHARSRRYRYHLRAPAGYDVGRLRAAMRLFVGEHDLSRFAKIEAGRDPVRRVRRVGVRRRRDVAEIAVEAPNFLWQQVRRMVAAADGVARSRWTLGEVRAALALPAVGGRDLGAAPARPLVLERIDFRRVSFGRPTARARRGLHEAGVHGRLLENLAAAALRY